MNVLHRILMWVLGIKDVSLILIGMSNVGKSHWAPLMQAFGYRRVCIDDEIEERLGPYLIEHGYRGIQDISKWMGQPYEPQYPANSALYLKYEKREMWKVVWRILNGEKLVVDTTGSVIYTGWFLLFILRLIAQVVLLDAPESHQDELYRKYIEEPKPVLWGDNAYAPITKEKPMEALARCYPNLLKTRNKRYRKLVRVTLGYFELRAPSYTSSDFLDRALGR